MNTQATISVKDKINIKLQELKSFFKLLKEIQFPLVRYIFILILTTYLSKTLVQSRVYASQIAAGEAFNNDIIIKYAIYAITPIVLMLPVYLYSIRLKCIVTKRCQEKMWNKFVDLPVKTYEDIGPSTLISRVINDSTFAGQFLVTIIDVLRSFTTITNVVILSLSISKPLTYLLIPAILFMTSSILFAGNLLAKRQKGFLNQLSSLTAFLSEKLSSLKFIKSEGTEEYECEMGNDAINQYFKSGLFLQGTDSAIWGIYMISEIIINICLFIGGGILIQKGAIDLTAFVTFFMYSSMLPGSCWSIIQQIIQLRKYKGGIDIVSHLNTLPLETIKREKSFTMPDNDIKFNKVSFSYDSNNKIIKNLSFSIPIGKTTAIVGPSGSGKTTLLKLLERFYTPTSGSITFGDTDINKIHLDEWRESFGYVVQNSSLLVGTIKENITYGLKDEVAYNKIVEACKLSNIYDFINELPDKFDTDIGELGGKLSGGQKQRIAIARAIIRNPNYLLLDEATANLDPINEYEVTEALNNLMLGRTVVVVAHNISTITRADNIIVLDNGEISDQGTHKYLYEINHIYKKYFDLQARKLKHN